MDFYFLILSSATVSLDSFFAGLSVGSEKGLGKQRKIFCVMAVVSALCLCAHFFGKILFGISQSIMAKAGGLILVCIGYYGLFPKRKPAFFVGNRRVCLFFEIFSLGIGVGVDGACACLSLILMNYGLCATVSVIIFHYLFMEIGVFLANAISLKGLKNAPLAPTILILLGYYKLLF